MRIPFWTAWKERVTAENLARQRHTDAWADRLIDEYEVHQLNEEIGSLATCPTTTVALLLGTGTCMCRLTGRSMQALNRRPAHER